MFHVATRRQRSSSVSELKSSLVTGRLQKSAQTADVLLPKFRAKKTACLEICLK